MMKPSNSKSQLIANRTKNGTDQRDTVYSAATRCKSQVQSHGKNRNNKSRTIAQIREEDSEINLVKSQQLFSIIDTFYNTLCSLPLETLTNSSEPQFWIEQQKQTLKELQRKLENFNKNKDHQYYKWKLESVSKIIFNIHANMGMLQRISHLKGYYSGTDTSNYRSRGSSSIESQQGSIKLGNLIRGQANVKEMLSYDIKQFQKPHKSVKNNLSPQLMAQTVNSDEESSDQKPMVHSEVFQKRQKTTRRERDGQNRNTMNFEGQSSFAKVKSRQLECKDKTLAKIAHLKGNRSTKTLSNYTNEGQFLQDRIINESNCQPTFDVSKQQYTEQSPTTSKDQQRQQFMVMIKQLRLQLMNKDRQIQTLLINEAQFQSGIEMFKDRQKQRNTEILFLKENVSNVNREKQKLNIEIKKLLDHQQELKQTIRFQRDRNKRQQRQKDRIEQKYFQQTNGREHLLDQISNLKDQNKSIRRNERIMKQKLQVYTKKYFKIYKDLQQSKQIQEMLIKQLQQIKNIRGKSQTRYDQIRQIVQYHKERLCDQSFQ